MSRHRLFYFMELKEPKATHGLFPSLSWCCYRVEWRPGQKFHDTCLDVGDGIIEVWQDKFPAGPARITVSADGITVQAGNPVDVSHETCAVIQASKFQGGLVARGVAFKK